MKPQRNFVRLVYASRATFPAGLDNASLNANVGRILMHSRRNNPASGLVGALYFAERCPATLSDMVGLLRRGPDAGPVDRPGTAAPTGTGDALSVARRAQVLASIALVGAVVSLAAAIVR